ncbi:YdiU family protein [Pseudorhodoferax sp. Leaf267]|uniref:protein adenylyltransferase SelO n=1 Tax=Pseudorhodoferax sp. Leaf267 TaxID=1736316 RepID=UPI0006F9F072|nr:YdiU family protein [Pseudorhodoferax sp. Leaf267]KQP14910.1 hypothetical protein ASF43_12695 [Pseudorhodoferax sp. Leaf267]
MRLPTDAADAALAEPAALAWQEGFARLGPAFYTRLQPTPLPAPYWVSRSERVAASLGLEPAWLASDEALQALTGNQLLPGSAPYASVYSGHQFGVWAGQLGDGRAIMLGETDAGLELQLKGAGRTPYSRGGDGRAVLRSSIREFLCSEAMAGLGIPTTRALSVTGSDAPIQRETVETAAVVARVAPSFIRFGHFEHFAASGDHAALRALADYVIDRHYPHCRAAEHPYAALLQNVTARTAAMAAQWQAVGFCHGVMNTDNMSILGLTIDYGPFQFLDAFDPGHVCNHSDSQGRYAFNRQPNVAYWNLFCLGQALLPLIEDQDVTLAALETYKTAFPAALESALRAKLGLANPRDDDRTLFDATLQLLAAQRTDYTIFWRRLSHAVAQGATAATLEPVRDLFPDRGAFDTWSATYLQRLAGADLPQAGASMLAVNPKFVLRNHLAEQAIQQAKAKDFSEVERLLCLLQTPYDEHPGSEAYADFPPDWASSIEISCSS